MSIADDIKAAADAGRAERAAADAVKAAERAREDERRAEQASIRAFEHDTWVQTVLPGLVRAAVAKGVRVYLGDGEAAACRRAGLTVESEWVEPWNDDGARFGGYYTHTLVLS